MASTRRLSFEHAASDHHDWYFQHGHLDADLSLVSPYDASFDITTLPRFADWSYPPWPPSSSDVQESAIDVDDDEDDADVARPVLCVDTTPSREITIKHISGPPDLAVIASSPVGSPLLHFHIPAFSEFSERKGRRALVDHFCNQLSHLIVFREETGNPFQELVLPLTVEESPVMNAIYALAGAHLEYRGVKNQERSVHFYNQAVQGLATVITRSTKTPGRRNELLAAIMLLVYYEVVSQSPHLGVAALRHDSRSLTRGGQLVQMGRSNLVDGHLRGAMTIMNSYPAANDATGMFLERVCSLFHLLRLTATRGPPTDEAAGFPILRRDSGSVLWYSAVVSGTGAELPASAAAHRARSGQVPAELGRHAARHVDLPLAHHPPLVQTLLGQGGLGDGVSRRTARVYDRRSQDGIRDELEGNREGTGDMAAHFTARLQPG